MLLEVLRKSDKSLTNKENLYSFVECSNLADDIKGNGGGWQADWHFIDLPWFDEGGSSKDFPEFKNSDKNLDTSIQYLISWLKEEKGAENSFVYKAIMKEVKCEEEGRSYALRLLIHLIGDIH